MSHSAVASKNRQEECSFFYFKTGALDIYRQFSKPNNCDLSINPSNQFGMIYRSILLTANGMMMVFNSYGPGSNSTSTAARVFYLFPRGLLPTVDNLSKSILVRGSNENAIFSFDRKNGKLIGLKDGSVFEDVDVNPKNNAGIEILNYNGLLIDVGFAIGKDPSLNKKGESVARDSENRQCKIKNTDLFEYTSGGGANLKFPTDDQLKIFMLQNCPDLKF
ncbi:MAG: hypothetical protein IPM57_05395 [Oligoflexia bacterium]|nr:hypothetical protein [Oligoflexia bacterium]